MASRPEFVQYIADQLSGAGQITYRKTGTACSETEESKEKIIGIQKGSLFKRLGAVAKYCLYTKYG